MELCSWHHGAEIHSLAPTVAIKLSFGGYTWNCHRGWPHHLVPCLSGGDTNSQLIEIGDDVSSRAILSLVVQHPGGWLPAVFYARHHQVYISFTSKGMHQWGGFPPHLPLSSVGCLAHPLQHAGVGHKPVWISHAPLHLLVSKKLANIEDGGSRWARALPLHLDVPPPHGHKMLGQGLSHTLCL